MIDLNYFSRYNYISLYIQTSHLGKIQKYQSSIPHSGVKTWPPALSKRHHFFGGLMTCYSSYTCYMSCHVCCAILFLISMSYMLNKQVISRPCKVATMQVPDFTYTVT